MRERMQQADKAFRSLIDRGSWKHTWHLPRTDGVSIDWLSGESRRCVRGQIHDAREEAHTLLEQARRAESLLDNIEEYYLSGEQS